MKKNTLFTPEMYKMQLGDEIENKNECLTRIPGGWLYYCNESSVFIPFNNEFRHAK